MSRTRNSIRNVIFTGVGFAVTTLLQLVNRKVFIMFLSSEYLGLNGLFSNILSMLSLSEMGVGAAIVFALYKPIAENDTEKIKSLMALYKKLYTFIGIFVLLIGAALIPFLHLLIKDMPDIPYIQLYYFMFVLDSGMSYFYSYKRSLIICNQDNYISTTTTMMASVGTRIVQLFILLLTHNYFLYLLVQICFTRLENVVISKIADKQYPYIKDHEYQKLSREEKHAIRNNVLAMMAHKIGGVVVNATDNLIISKVLGLSVLGIYSNYVLLTQTIDGLMYKIFSSVTASIGNLIAEKSKEEIEDTFNRMLFLNYWIINFCTICLLCLIQPFIRLWIGQDYQLSIFTVVIIVTVFYFSGMRKTVLEFRDAAGLFWADRYKALIEAAVNLIASIPLTYILGVAGVKIGTLISMLGVAFWVEGWVLYKYLLKKPVSTYLFRQTKYAIYTIIQGGVTYFLCDYFINKGIIGFVIQVIICLIIPNLLMIILFRNTDEFNYVIDLLKKIIKKYHKKEGAYDN